MSRPLSINSNPAAMASQRLLARATESLGENFARLSSGLRINTAGDDAAGLAIASSLAADTRVYTQGVKNLNDGVSATSIADGALEQLSSVVTRIRELAAQSANGSVGATQRKSLDAEAQSLAAEYFRIAQSTKFNGIALFAPSTGTIRLQGGYGAAGGLASELGGSVGTGTFNSPSSYLQSTASEYDIAVGDLNNDGISDMVTTGSTSNWVRLGVGDGTFGAVKSVYLYTPGAMTTTGKDIALADLNGDGNLDMVTSTSIMEPTFQTKGRVVVVLGNGDGTFRSAQGWDMEPKSSDTLSVADINNDGISDLVTAGIDNSNGGFLSVRLGNGNGSFKALTQTPLGTAQPAVAWTPWTTWTAGSYVRSAETGFLTYRCISEHESSNDFSFDLSGGYWSLEPTTTPSLPNELKVADLNGDGRLDVTLVGKDGGNSGYTSIFLGNGNGTFQSYATYVSQNNAGNTAVTLGEFNGDGKIDMLIAGRDTMYSNLRFHLGNGNGSFKAGTGLSTVFSASPIQSMTAADMNSDGILDFITAAQGAAEVFLNNGNGTFARGGALAGDTAGSYGVAASDLNGDGVLDFVTVGEPFVGMSGTATVRLAKTRSGIGPLLSFSLQTVKESLDAMSVMENALNNLTKQKGIIGAFQSRMRAALGTLQTATLNYAAAQSRVEDVDVGAETSQMMKNQILQKSATAVLAHANLVPSLSLRLLKPD